MTYLLRQTRRSNWVGDLTDDRRDRAHATFSRRDVDVDGVSLYAIEDEQQESLVVAAYATQKREGPSTLDFLHLEKSEVETFGEVTLSPGSMAVRIVNPWHRLLVWSPQKLAEFVEDLLARRKEAKRYTAKVVAEAVLSLDLEGIDEPQRAWVKDLKDRRAQGPTSGRGRLE